MIRWTPLSVSTTSLISPILRLYVASSKGFCIWPRPKLPRSPPRLAELQSERREATSSNLALPETMSSRMAWSWETALSLVVLLMTLPSGSFHEAFLREPWCLIKMWDALTWLADDIFGFFLWLLLSLSLSFVVGLRSADEIELFFLFRSDSIFAAAAFRYEDFTCSEACVLYICWISLFSSLTVS